jgi:ATP-binding cassette subfamily B protein
VPEKLASVEFKNVDYRYPGASEKVLDSVSFKAVAGETVAFIGSTGSGKSTLVNLVPRFYEASSGEVLINGVPIRNYAKEDLMRRIGLVPQRGMLFAGTVKSNIKFGAPTATDEQVHKAARIAQAENFIEKLPKKYESHIAQGGTNVSGGQKQRLSIARAICKNPVIFVFDDAFSALDMKTDAKLRAALKEVTAEAVVLIVAQRVSTIKDADQIVVLNNGKVMGKGRHLELLRKCKVYQEIVKSQLSDAEYARELKLAEKYDAKAESKRAASQEDVTESAGKSSLERGSYAAA